MNIIILLILIVIIIIIVISGIVIYTKNPKTNSLKKITYNNPNLYSKPPVIIIDTHGKKLDWSQEARYDPLKSKIPSKFTLWDGEKQVLSENIILSGHGAS